MRVELFDNEGNRYTIAFEGQITREKAIRLLDLVELLGGMPGESAQGKTGFPQSDLKLTRFEKVMLIIKKNLPLIWFSSKDLQLIYEQEVKEPISLSTVSTYLARMTSRGVLIRTGGPTRLKYKLTPNMSQTTLRQRS